MFQRALGLFKVRTAAIAGQAGRGEWSAIRRGASTWDLRRVFQVGVTVGIKLGSLQYVWAVVLRTRLDIEFSSNFPSYHGSG